MINFPRFNRVTVGNAKPQHASTTHSSATRKDRTEQKADRRIAADRRKQRAKIIKGLERRCGDRRSGRINLSV